MQQKLIIFCKSESYKNTQTYMHEHTVYTQRDYTAFVAEEKLP